VLQEGLAHVCLITPSMTVVRQRIEVAIPKKRRGDTTQHDKAMQRCVRTPRGAAAGNADAAVGLTHAAAPTSDNEARL